MVVTRKPPVPPTPTSRTPSTQPLPRVAKGKSVLTSPELSSPLANGNSRNEVDRDLSGDASNADALKKGRTKSKWKRKGEKKSKKSRTRGFFDFLTNIIITAIIIYSFTVCPNAQQTAPSPLCHALSEYRRLVLEPYIFPSVQYVLAHPSLAPYVGVVQPRVTHAIAVAKPIAIRAQTEFNGRVVPQWHKYVVPQYNAHLAPYVHKVEETLQPYLVLAGAEYEHYAGPYARLVAVKLWKWQQQAQPYVIMATNKTYDGYKAVKPYARPAWEQFMALIFQLVDLAGRYRQQFVDPHVAKMWNKIEELSTGRKFSSPTAESAIAPDDYTLTKEPTTVPAESTNIATAFSRLVPTEEPLASAMRSAQDETVVTETETASVFAITAEAMEFFPAEPLEVLIETSEVVIDVTEAPVPENTPSASSTGEVSSGVPTAVSTPLSDGDDIDLDAFYVELGLHEPDSPGTDEQIPFSVPPEESEEEQAARLTALQEQTARKRQDITGRHSRWEAELEDLIIEKKKAFRKTLVALRKAAASELKDSADIKNAIDGLVRDAEKYIKGAERYLENLSKEDRGKEGKRALWTRVVDKVDEKFTQRLQGTEVVVNQQYELILQAELQEIERTIAPVQDTAERAQADIGLDYAWLADVTYEDWQRYHDLIRRSENFQAEVRMIQNGTHPSLPTNPVLSIIGDLQAEVSDIIVGFETRLRRIKRNGDRVLGHLPTDDHPSEGDDVEEPVASILPVVPEDILKEAVPPVVIGKSREEILQALENAGYDAALPSSTFSPEEGDDRVIERADHVQHEEL